MTPTLKSKIVAATLALGMAAPLTLGGSLLSSTAAQAGFVSSITGATRTVGGAVANTARGIGAAGKAAGALGKQVGVGMYRTVKPGAVAVGREVAKIPVVKDAIYYGHVIRRSF